MTEKAGQAIPETGGSRRPGTDRARKQYSRPVLVFHGDLRIVQAGTSPGNFDSQFPNTRP